MHDRDCFKLIGGPYRTPRCKVGGLLRCAMRGKVRVRGIHEAKIQWPYTLRKTGGGRPMLILCGDLARAVRVESETAICHWWGVGTDTVWKWRKALGVPQITEGTSDLMSRWAPETILTDEAKRNAAAATQRPERNAKIAAAWRGKPRPRHVNEALQKANRGRKLSAEHPQKLSEASKRPGAYPPAAGVPWTAEEEALLGTMKDADVAVRTGRTRVAV